MINFCFIFFTVIFLYIIISIINVVRSSHIGHRQAKKILKYLAYDDNIWNCIRSCPILCKSKQTLAQHFLQNHTWHANVTSTHSQYTDKRNQLNYNNKLNQINQKDNQHTRVRYSYKDIQKMLQKCLSSEIQYKITCKKHKKHLASYISDIDQSNVNQLQMNIKENGKKMYIKKNTSKYINKNQKIDAKNIKNAKYVTFKNYMIRIKIPHYLSKDEFINTHYICVYIPIYKGHLFYRGIPMPSTVFPC